MATFSPFTSGRRSPDRSEARARRSLRVARASFARVVAALAVVAAVEGAPAWAAEVHGVRFEESIEASDGRELRLIGAARLRWGYFIDVFTGALYLGESSSTETGARLVGSLVEADPAPVDAASPVSAGVPMALELCYARDIEARHLVRAATAGLEQNLTPEMLAALAPRIEKMNALYQDVKAGDRYRVTYTPAAGLELSLNGNLLGAVEGADFARAYLSIWLGADPISESFKRDLLAAVRARSAGRG